MTIKQYLAKHPHLGHTLHSVLHVAYFAGVAASNISKLYGGLALVLAISGLIAIWKGGEP